jgi:hypothetical protein
VCRQLTRSSKSQRFVQKSGPLFWLLDSVESIVRWEDPFKAVFFGSLWVLLSLYPRLILLVPNVIVLSFLLWSYGLRYPPGSDLKGLEGNNRDASPTAASDSSQATPAVEASVEYAPEFSLFRRLQRMADLTYSSYAKLQSYIQNLVSV